MKINSNEVLVLSAMRDMPPPRYAQDVCEAVQSKHKLALTVGAVHSMLRSMRGRGLVSAKAKQAEGGRRIEFSATAKAERAIESLRAVLEVA